MAEFTANFQSLKPSPFPLMDMDPNQIPSLNFLDNIPVLFNDSFFGNQAAVPPRFPEIWGENFCQANQITAPVFEPTNPSGNDLHGSKKRRLQNEASESSSGNSTPQTKNVFNSSKNPFFWLYYCQSTKLSLGCSHFHVCRTLEKESGRKRATKTTERNRGKWFMLEPKEVKQQTVTV